MKPWLFAILLGAVCISAGQCAGRESPSPSSHEGPIVDMELMAYVSAARALHHEANLRETSNDFRGAAEKMERLVALRTPHPEARPAEVEEVLADAYARLAELRLRQNDVQGAARATDEGLGHAKTITYFRGHLLEVRGIVDEAYANELADAGRKDEAEKIKMRAMESLDEAISVQERVIQSAAEARDAAPEPANSSRRP